MSDFAEMFDQAGLTDEVDVDSLVGEIGLDTEAIKRRKEFLGFDEDDVERLHALNPLFEANAERIGELFYEHLTNYDGTDAVASRSPKTVDALTKIQEAYFVTLTEGAYGEDYVTNRARIGKLHEILDMPLNRYIGQYGVYYDLVLPLLTERTVERLCDRLDSSEATATDGGTVGVDDGAATTRGIVEDELSELRADLAAVLRIITLDTGIIADVYSHSNGQNQPEEIDQREQLAVDIEADLREPIADLRQSTDDVTQSSQEISTLADEQSDRIQSISNEVSNMSATVEEIAYSATEVKDTSEHAEALAEDGQDAATDAMAVMDDVGEAVEEVSTDVDDLQTRVGEIDSVVEVINDIAEQTNILALNASIEAARAGEAGAGFAVVADEVKSLAGDSQERAQEIETLVAAIESDTEQTVESLTETTEEIERGADRVSEAMELLDDISTAIEETAHGIREVSNATDEQAASSEEVASMLDELVDRADTVATEAGEIAAANEEQAMTIEEVSQTVRQLTD